MIKTGFAFSHSDFRFVSYFVLCSSDLTSMPLAEFLAELDQLCREAESAFDAAGDAAALEAARIDFLGMKSGRLKTAQKGSARSTRPTSPRPASGSTKSSSTSTRLSKRRQARWRAARRQPPPARNSIPRCPASARASGICTRSRRRSKNSKTSWAGSVSPRSTARRSKTSGTTSRR